MTSAEFCDWGMGIDQPEAIYNHEREGSEVIMRNYNQLSIGGWPPCNETVGAARTHGGNHKQALEWVCQLTLFLALTRPINDGTGYVNVRRDIFTVHDCDQNPVTFQSRFDKVNSQKPEDANVYYPEVSIPYEGQPYVVDEYGGTF